MSWAEKVAAEVAARYGVKVDPAVVKRVPRGVSSYALPIFDGQKFVDPDAERRQREAQRYARNFANKGRVLSPEVTARRDLVRASHERGMTVPAIMSALSLPEYTVRMDLRRMGLQFHPAPNPPPVTKTPPAVVERRKKVAALLAQGMSQRAIAKALGLQRSTVLYDARALAAAGAELSA